MSGCLTAGVCPAGVSTAHALYLRRAFGGKGINDQSKGRTWLSGGAPPQGVAAARVSAVAGRTMATGLACLFWGIQILQVVVGSSGDIASYPHGRSCLLKHAMGCTPQTWAERDGVGWRFSPVEGRGWLIQSQRFQMRSMLSCGPMVRGLQSRSDVIHAALSMASDLSCRCSRSRVMHLQGFPACALPWGGRDEGGDDQTQGSRIVVPTPSHGVFTLLGYFCSRPTRGILAYFFVFRACGPVLVASAPFIIRYSRNQYESNFTLLFVVCVARHVDQQL